MSVTSNASMGVKMDKLGVPADVQDLVFKVQNEIKKKLWVDIKGRTVNVDITKYPDSVYAQLVNKIKQYGSQYAGSFNYNKKDAKEGAVNFITYAADVAKSGGTLWQFIYGAPFPVHANSVTSPHQTAFTKGASDIAFTGNYGVNKQLKQDTKQLNSITMSTLQNPEAAVKALEDTFKIVYGNVATNPNPESEKTLGAYLNTVASYVANDKTPNKSYRSRFIAAALSTDFLREWLLQSYDQSELDAMSGDAKETLVKRKDIKKYDALYNNGTVEDSE